ncbi:MAG: hypothetical protein KBC84_11360 [Proteobacteria bacterium]|nr:hypothetical protein [Pseudomonadota bacterium]
MATETLNTDRSSEASFSRRKAERSEADQFFQRSSDMEFVRRLGEYNVRWSRWRAGLNEGEVALYNQGLLDYQQPLGPGTRRILASDGTRHEIQTEGVRLGRGGTLFVPCTPEAQRVHGEAIARSKSSAI